VLGLAVPASLAQAFGTAAGGRGDQAETGGTMRRGTAQAG